MGKHKRGQTGRKVAKGGPDKPYLINDTSICKVVDDLWKLLQHNSSDQLKSLWDEYDRIQVIIEQLRDLQAHPASEISRSEKIPSFEEWLQGHGAVYFENLEIMEISGIGFGLRSRKDIKADEKVLEIPEKLMLSSHSAMQGVLGVLIDQDRMLKSMPNISLALHLLNERCSSSSFWKPYIDILPNSFTLPLYFTKQDLLLLQGSPCLVKCLLQVRNIAKLYSHLHKTLRATGEDSLPIFKSGFLYDDFIWAVSCVMSRQNEIPSKPGHTSPTLALIPLWDLCNHSRGHISTYYNVESSTCDSYAQQDFKMKEEFTIFYGPRTNCEFLLQQGFVYPQNKSDCYQIKLGLSSMEEQRTKSLRIEILHTINIPVSGYFLLTNLKEQPFSCDMLAFVRIFTAPLNVLEEYLQERKTLDKLKDTQLEVGDCDALEFLEKRCSLLLRLYPSSISDDEKCLESEISACCTQALIMRMCEKEFLVDAARFAKETREELKQKFTALTKE